MMDRFELQKLRDLPIEGVAERLGLRVTRHKSLCPFHNDHHESLFFLERKNTCRCFVCMTKSMGTIDLVMKHLHLDFKEACRWLGDAHNIILTEWKANPSTANEPTFDAKRYAGFFARPYLSPEARHFLFTERKLHPAVVRWCRLTSWKDRQGVNWLQIPYYNRKGELVGIQNRNLQKGANPRFCFPKGAQCGVYNLQVIQRLREGESLFITEGCTDCWAMLSAGHKAIAIPSATLLTPATKRILEQVAMEKQPVFEMYPDRDAPGEQLFLQLQELLPGLVHHQLPPDCKDFSDYFVKQVNPTAHGNL